MYFSVAFINSIPALTISEASVKVRQRTVASLALLAFGVTNMKRIAISMLTLAITAAAGGALAAPQDYRNDSRYNDSNYDDRYDDRYENRRVSNRRNDLAQVIRVERMNNPYGAYQRQECWNEQTRDYDDGYYRDDYGRLYRGDDRNSKTGVVVGAIVGGALGNQVGKGDGRDAATVAGAIIGGVIGNNVARDSKQYEYRDDSNSVRRCRTVYDDNNSSRYGNYDSYKVTYRYAGQTYTAMTDYRPGRTIRVTVNVRLQEDNVRYGNR